MPRTVELLLQNAVDPREKHRIEVAVAPGAIEITVRSELRSHAARVTGDVPIVRLAQFPGPLVADATMSIFGA